MTIDEKIKQAADEYKQQMDRNNNPNVFSETSFNLGVSLVKSEMLADMQKMAEALEYYNSLSDRVSVEYAYKDNTFCYNVVTDARLETLAGQVLAEFNAKYKGLA